MITKAHFKYWIKYGILFLTLITVLSACTKKEEDKDITHIAINSPSKEEVLIEGSTYIISYKSTGVDNINIDLYKDNILFYTIAKNVKANERYEWNIEVNVHDSSVYELRIIDTNNGSVSASSGNGFRIIPPFKKSTLTDPRDGRTYNTVKIGDLWWMAENFRYDCEGSSFYFDIDSLGEVYGRIYTFESARSNAPEGWHLPTDEEWKSLERIIGVPEDELNNVGIRSHCAGDLLIPGGGSGFNALYGGYNNLCANRYGHIYQEAHFWTSTSNDKNQPIVRIIGGIKTGINRVGTFCHSGCSVRYVKDN